MGRIAILNGKGGCGKSTLATNLVGWYATENTPVALMDYDPQASSTAWLKNRPESCPRIFGVEAYRPPSSMVTRSWQLRVPLETRRVIIDTPASIDNPSILNFVNQVDTILIPVQPSAPDIHAVTRFIERLLIVGKVRRRNIRVGVIANRVKLNLAVYRGLLRFLTVLEFPLIAQLHDSHAYLEAMSRGLSIFELEDGHADCDRQEWLKLIEWIEAAKPQGGAREKSARLRSIA